MDVLFPDSNLFNYFIMPLSIFLLHMIDVTIGTVRIILVSRGKKYVVPILGFIQVFVWLFAISGIVQNLHNYINYFAFAGGFAAGNYIGMLIEEKIALGKMIVRIITQRPADRLIEKLHSQGYGITSVNARGYLEDVDILYSVIHRNELNTIIEKIKQYNPRAFFSVEDVRFVNEGTFPIRRSMLGRYPNGSAFRRWRKDK